ncbi:MAG: hypothetical protein A2031_03110 [Deltaproteobacteria bacterium RBG_19FT_COMBO_43_11]|nr:MAG: hypothetical protein A2031_03110 [Deltaproteobacteria bacterium RBG_19FT_COMBO_43_11]
MKNEKWLITRRDFMRGTVGAALGTSLLGVGRVFGAENNARSSLVTVVRNEKVMDAEGSTVDAKILREMLDQAVMLTTGEKNAKDAWLRLVKPKDTVGIVRNPAAHSELYDALEASLVEAGIPKDKVINARGLPSFSGADTCTALISLPALKVHLATGIATVMKNYIMYSNVPSKYHGEGGAKLGEIWHLPIVKGKTKLVLVDALFPLCDKGPQVDPRYKWAYNGLIAGTDPVAVEAVCVRILEEKRRLLHGEPWPLSPPPLCLEAADRIYHLGTSKLDEIQIKRVGWAKDHLLPV